MANQIGLTDLQIDIMRILWKRGDASVADVHREIQHTRQLAQPTIATMLSRLEKKGAVTHTVEGRQFIYRAALKEADVKRSMIAQMKDSLFSSDIPAVVSQLLAGREISREDLDEVKALIEAKERELAKSSRKRR